MHTNQSMVFNIPRKFDFVDFKQTVPTFLAKFNLSTEVDFSIRTIRWSCPYGLCDEAILSGTGWQTNLSMLIVHPCNISLISVRILVVFFNKLIVQMRIACQELA